MSLTSNRESSSTLTAADAELASLQLALDSHAIVSTTDPAGTITYVNERFCLMSGYSRDELLGASHRIIRSDRHPPAYFQEMWRTISSNQVWQGVVCNRRKDGRLYWVESTIVPFSDTNGEIYKYVSVRTDITRQKQTEELLAAMATAQSEIITESSPQDVFSKLLHELLRLTDSSMGLIAEVNERNPSIHPSKKINFLAIGTMVRDPRGNPACVTHEAHGMQSLGLHPVFQAASDLSSPSILNSRETSLDELPEGHAPVHHLLRLPFLRGSSTVGFVGLANRPGGYDSQIVDLLAPLTNTCANIIEGIRNERARKASLEALRIAKSDAERANDAKSEFLSRMTHELRTPLNAIIGFSQLMETDTVDVLPPSHQENVEQILKAGWHLRQLIDQVLDLSQVEAGRTELEQSPFDLLDVISESLMLISSLAQQRGIALNFKTEVESASLLADPMRVKQILTNLLSNAVKYNQPEGQVEVSVIATQGEWGVAVVDTGRGIAPTDLARVFMPFTRVGDKRAIAGLGIGLDISRRFAELMGGRIEAVSELGSGSTFTLWLPRQES